MFGLSKFPAIGTSTQRSVGRLLSSVIGVACLLIAAFPMDSHAQGGTTTGEKTAPATKSSPTKAAPRSVAKATAGPGNTYVKTSPTRIVERRAGGGAGGAGIMIDCTCYKAAGSCVATITGNGTATCSNAPPGNCSGQCAFVTTRPTGVMGGGGVAR